MISAAILEQLDASMEYNKDGYSGVLTLTTLTIQTEAAGYTTKYYTITDTQAAYRPDRNDPPMSLLLLSKTEAP